MKKKMTLNDLASLASLATEAPAEQESPAKEFPVVGQEGWVVIEMKPITINRMVNGDGTETITYQKQYKVKRAGKYRSYGYDSNLNRISGWELLGPLGSWIACFPTEDEASAYISSMPAETFEECIEMNPSASNHVRGWMGRDSDW